MMMCGSALLPWYCRQWTVRIFFILKILMLKMVVNVCLCEVQMRKMCDFNLNSRRKKTAHTNRRRHIGLDDSVFDFPQFENKKIKRKNKEKNRDYNHWFPLKILFNFFRFFFALWNNEKAIIIRLLSPNIYICVQYTKCNWREFIRQFNFGCYLDLFAKKQHFQVELIFLLPFIFVLVNCANRR